jgi:hypothetical protein
VNPAKPTENGATILDGEEGKHLRIAILELIEVCKRMTFALAQQVIDSRSTMQILEESLMRMRTIDFK